MKLFRILIAAGLALPALANADPINVAYEGVVTSEYGDTYNVGDTVSGYFEFDTDDFIRDASRYRCGYGRGPVTSDTDPVGSGSGDYVQNCSGYYGNYYDSLYVEDESWGYSDGGYRYDYHREYISLSDYYSSTFDGTWSDAWYGTALLDSLYGAYGFVRDYSRGYDVNNDYRYFRDDDYAYFNLTSVHIRGMEVSEPGTLALFGLGLIGLGFARRRKAT